MFHVLSSYGRVTAVPGQGAMPKIWLLGSSTHSTQLAGAIGLPFAHGGHFAAGNSVAAVAAYRQIVPLAGTAEAVRNRLSGSYLRRNRRNRRAPQLRGARQPCAQFVGTPRPLFSVDEIETGQPGKWSLAQEHYVTELFFSHIVGSPSTVKAGLQTLARRTGANEIMISPSCTGQNSINDPRVLKCQRSQFMGQREDDVAIRNRQNLRGPIPQPLIPCPAVALWAVAVTA
jgi:alkanesulfonate monooxygenase SsuD/methylene tetrahydromethanopterin reductase-like flavin-dependent oxidoreductase (luciferase family)